MTSAVVLQVGAAIPSSPVEMVLAATAVTKFVLVLLAVLSVLSWAIMFGVGRQIGAAIRAAERFHREFMGSPRLEHAGALARRTPGALSRLVQRALQFVGDVRMQGGALAERVAPLTGSQIETLRLVLDSETEAERNRLGRFLPWLASIGSVSPLIGLLGTVLGVIESFLGIATKGSGNLSAVAPGVAEALIATAAALAVAIPATFGYNILANRLNRLDSRMESFGTEVIVMLAREGHL